MSAAEDKLFEELRELRELTAELMVLLRDVSMELDSAREGEWPVPDDFAKAWRQREAMVAAVKLLPEDVQTGLRALVDTELKDARDSGARDPPGFEMPKIVGEMEYAIDELVRHVRAVAGRDPELRDAISLAERASPCS